MRLAAILALSLLPVTTACATRPPAPADLAQPFVLNETLTGRTTGRGVFSAINGVRRDFVADLNGFMEGDTFVLEERFRFGDGTEEFKTWRLTRQADGEWRGTREDVIGEARGFQDGNAFRLEYTAQVGGRKLRFRDVLYLDPSGDVLNVANVGLWGFKVGSVRLRITREAELTS